MQRIGPAGNSVTFYASGNKHTYQAAEWLSKQGLNAFEYSFGRGVNIKEDSAKLIAEQMKKFDIAISAHAPYYINLANIDDEAAKKSFAYIKKSLNMLGHLGGNRLVVHTATLSGSQRQFCLELVKKRLEMLLGELFDEGFCDFLLCLETMGKYSQIGTVEEILDFCTLSDRLIPCFDFGHINALTQGGLKTEDDYKRIFDLSFETIGDQRTKNVHIHFSKIEYGKSGEIRHLDFSDQTFGPDFEPLAKVIAEFGICPVIICESKDVMSDDALIMKKILQKYI